MTPQRKFAVLDIDGTLIRWQLYHAIVDQLAKGGHVPAEAYEKARQARNKWKQREGEEAFRAYELELISAFEAALPNLSVYDFLIAADAVFDRHKDQVYRFTRELLKELKAKDYLTFAISASPYEVVEMVAKYYHFDDWVGSMYAQKDGRFTGQLNEVVHRKATYLEQLIRKHDASTADSIGVGDSDSDIPMLELVEHPIAYNPTRKLFSYAQAASWKMVVERKNVIYELEPDGAAYKLKIAD